MRHNHSEHAQDSVRFLPPLKRTGDLQQRTTDLRGWLDDTVPPSEDELRRRYDALRQDRIEGAKFEFLRAVVSDGLLLVLAVALFVVHWRLAGAPHGSARVALPNKRLKLSGADRFKGSGVLCPWRGTDCRPTPLRRRAGRPQLKRDPLGLNAVNTISVGAKRPSCSSLP